MSPPADSTNHVSNIVLEEWRYKKGNEAWYKVEILEPHVIVGKFGWICTLKYEDGCSETSQQLKPPCKNLEMAEIYSEK